MFTVLSQSWLTLHLQKLHPETIFLFTKQATHRYILKALVVSLASADVKNYIKSKDREVRHFQVFSRSFYIQTIPGRGTWPDLPEVYLAPAVTY